ncbi:MAG TPA: phosphoribosyltransferase family protein [Balneolales bacterium]|nr:phosphoribosyltransferase family protein [Balneolales bacterium]
MLRNRAEAGERLAKLLTKYQQANSIILGLIPGGVEVGYHAAKKLDVNYSILLTARLNYPHNPEAAFGALAEDGSRYIADIAQKDLVDETIEDIVNDQMKEIIRLKDELRNGKPLPDLKGKKVILINDGIVTAASLQAAIKLCQNQEAEEIVVAAPVADKNIVTLIESLVNDVIVLESYRNCKSIPAGYQEYSELSEQDLKHFWERWNMEHHGNID